MEVEQPSTSAADSPGGGGGVTTELRLGVGGINLCHQVTHSPSRALTCLLLSSHHPVLPELPACLNQGYRGAQLSLCPSRPQAALGWRTPEPKPHQGRQEDLFPVTPNVGAWLSKSENQCLFVFIFPIGPAELLTIASEAALGRALGAARCLPPQQEVGSSCEGGVKQGRGGHLPHISASPIPAP